MTEEIIKTAGFIIVYLAAGFFWLRFKWRLYVNDPVHAYTIKNLREGDERDYFVRQASYLYPHFFYWPFSLLHVIVSDLFFRAF